MSAATPAAGPLVEYEARLQARKASLQELDQRYVRVSNLRALVAFGGVALLIAILNLPIPGWWMAAPVAGFIALAIWHEVIYRAQNAMKRRVAFYERGIARLGDAWAGQGTSGERFRNAEHVYADDLDLFGTGSLFELLCACRTEGGEARLASWLSAPADVETARARQEAITELKPKVDLREDWAELGEGVRSAADSKKLGAWARHAVENPSSAERIGLFVISASGPILFIASSAGWLPFSLPLIHFLAIGLLHGLYHKRVERITEGLESSANDLGVLAQLIGYLEQQSFQSRLLQLTQAKVKAEGTLASVEIGRLRRLVDLLDSAHNLFFSLVAFWLLWEPQFAFAFAAWKRKNSRHAAEWLEALAEMEALLSLAGYAFENPRAQFPELLPEGRRFAATGLGHPLIPAARAVTNAVTLDDATRLLIISGSNMSGKSTMLRSVGLNAVLAWAGAPVRADSLAISPFVLGASFRTMDSVQEGRSRFFAELLRLRQISKLAEGPKPVLFLLDELFSGTNSHDRLEGSSMLLRGLLERGASGLVTTHDLALTQLADGLSGALNVHFSDEFSGGEMHFDYKMKPGVVHHSNAMELMRSVGLI